MPSVDLTKDEWGQLMNVLATTKEHPWLVTNPLLMKIGQQLNTVKQPGPPPGMRPEANGGKEVGHE